MKVFREVLISIVSNVFASGSMMLFLALAVNSAVANQAEGSTSHSSNMYLPGSEQVLELYGKEMLMWTAGPNLIVLEGEDGRASIRRNENSRGFEIKSTFANGIGFVKHDYPNGVDRPVSRADVQQIYNLVRKADARINGRLITLADIEALYFGDPLASNLSGVTYASASVNVLMELIGIQSVEASSAACYAACEAELNGAGLASAIALVACGAVIFTAGGSLWACISTAGVASNSIQIAQNCIDDLPYACHYEEMQ